MPLLEQYQNSIPPWPGCRTDVSASHDVHAGENSHTANPLIPNVLVVDDDAAIREHLARVYTTSGYTVVTVSSAEEALVRLARGIIDIVITDIKLPGMSGSELIANMQESFPDVPVIALTGYSDIETAIDVLKHGASDFVVKPYDLTSLQESTRAALEKSQVYMEIRHLRRYLSNSSEFGRMLSKTAEMHRLFEVVRMVAPTDMTVLIEGETGTGKELVASAIHYHSLRKNGPFVAISCGGVSDALFESELFGDEKGVFGGADQFKAGKIELARGGTLFLDEIESISSIMQAKLLRVLEDQRFQRLGGSESIQIDMRVIAATNVPLKDLVSEGKMRSDFYYRINVIPLHLIPLRQRRVDIPLLVQDFLHRHPVAASKGITSVSKNVMRMLVDYCWPGNIRELQNLLERAIVLTTGKVIEAIDFPSGADKPQQGTAGNAFEAPLSDWLREQEKAYLAQKLALFQGNIATTAKSCGIGVRTLSRKMRSYGLDKKLFKHNKSIAARHSDGPETPPFDLAPRKHEVNSG
jgi:DNA-binding NtrC family response regulator